MALEVPKTTSIRLLNSAFSHSAAVSYFRHSIRAPSRKEEQACINSHFSHLKRPECRGRPPTSPSNLLHLLSVPRRTPLPLRPILGHHLLRPHLLFLKILAPPTNSPHFPPKSPPLVAPLNLTCAISSLKASPPAASTSRPATGTALPSLSLSATLPSCNPPV